MEVKIFIHRSEKPFHFKKVINTYTKDGLFCVLLGDDVTAIKVPFTNISYIKEV